MNCHDCERALLGHGGEPSAAEAAAVAAHLQACPQCRALQFSLAEALAQWRAETATQAPDAAAAWQSLRPRLTARRKQPRRLAPLIWLSAPLAAAAALALVFYHPTPAARGDGFASAHADYVEAGNPAASTVVYVDNDSGWLVVWAADAER